MAVAPSSPISDGKREAKSKRTRLSLPKKPPTEAPSPSPAPSSSPALSPAKRTKNPGVRVVHGRIYDSEHGKTCHQCRQKTRDFVASCKRMRGDKLCTIKFCHKCLLNRYGEKAEEMAKLEDWNCPKCRGVCNCSFCMKKKGHQPTGILVHTAKATGFSSVLELLHHKGSDFVDAKNAVKDETLSSKSSPLPSKGLVTSKRSPGKENHPNEQKGSKPLAAGTSKEKKKLSKKLPVPKQENLQERAFTEPSTGFTKTEVLLDGNKKQASSVVDDINAEARPSKVRKLKQHAIDNAKTDKETLQRKIPDLVSLKQEGSLDGYETKVSFGENMCNAKAKPLPKICKPVKHCIVSNPKREDVVLPQGTALTTIAGVEFPEDIVGPALQFLEFCNAFSKVLDIKKGQADYVLRELARGRTGRRGVCSPIVQFHIKLLSIIQKDLGEKPLSYSLSSGNSWMQALGKCINDSPYALKELPLDCCNSITSGYDNLDISTKLRLLNFLCDETLGTEKLRNWIDEEYTKFIEKKREVNEKVFAAKKREKSLKQKLKDDMARAVLSSRDGTPLSVSEHVNLISKIRIQTEKAHTEMLESINLLPKNKQKPDAVRTEPMLLEGSGHTYWKLRAYCSGSNVLLQDIENWDVIALRDKWFVYDDEEDKIIEKYVSSVRNRRLKRRKNSGECALEDGGERINQDYLDNSDSPNCSTEGGSGTGS